jgi:hypothetical protein
VQQPGLAGERHRTAQRGEQDQLEHLPGGEREHREELAGGAAPGGAPPAEGQQHRVQQGAGAELGHGGGQAHAVARLVGDDKLAHGEIGGQRRAAAGGHERDEPGGPTEGERDHGDACAPAGDQLR